MAKSTTAFECNSCGATSIKWTGRCSRCGEFDTVVEVATAAPAAGLRASSQGKSPLNPARPVAQVMSSGPVRRTASGIGEFDRVLGGGFVAGQVVLCSGPPGSGKSTLVLAVADALAKRTAKRVLYVSGEESVEQIAIRAKRIGADSEHLLLADDTDLSMVIGHIEDHASELALVIIDSVQTVASAEVDGRAGGVTQVMEVATVLTRIAKSRNIPMILIGQVTKDSNVAGPRALEHIVDATLSLDGDKHTSLRLLRSVKNRFGSLEVAAFEQTDTGMREVVDPSVLFRGQREEPVPGTCVTVTLEGHRALIAEVQSLVAPNPAPNPRRGVSGLDSARVAMLIAVTERAAQLRLSDKDVFLATVGGMRISDPGTDMAICLAIVSAGKSGVVPMDMAAIGEVTLSGDIRQVPNMTERVSEAIRLGYRRLLVPVGTKERVNGRAAGGQLIEVPTVNRAFQALGTAGTA
ncbi:MAG: DNA repair protein RadA [Candidatus Nanopelagicales bacterium]